MRRTPQGAPLREAPLPGRSGGRPASVVPARLLRPRCYASVTAWLSGDRVTPPCHRRTTYGAPKVLMSPLRAPITH